MRRLRNRLAAFGREDRGSVTIQVIFFSLMVFGATGIVLDAGRVYDTHSRIQIYADHMAYLAASELDRQDDSIERATNAVFGNQILGADKNTGYYTVSDIRFFDGMQPSVSLQNDMSQAFPDDMHLATTTGVGDGDSVDAAVQSSATHVVVTVAANVSAVTRFVTQTIPDIGYGNTVNDGADDRLKQIGPDNYDLEVVAAATLNRESCAQLTTLVMCNPWEDQSGAANALEVEKTDPNYSVPGRSLVYFAPNFAQAGVPSDRIIQNGENHGSLFPWNENHQLFQIDGADADPAGLCSGDFLRNLAGQVVSGDASSQEYLDARDRCLMARATAPAVCWSDDDPLAIRPASGDTVVRSVNTIFDIWNEPFDTILADASSVDPTGTAPITAADFFEPDRLAISTYETADRFGVDDTGVHACSLATEADGVTLKTDPVTGFAIVADDRLVQDGIPDYNQAWPCDVPELDPSQPNFGLAPEPGEAGYDVSLDESHSSNASPDSFQPAYDTIPQPGWTYLAGTRGEGVGYDFCHDKTLGRQDTARQDLAQCLLDVTGDGDPTTTPAQCQADYVNATSFDGCAASATPGREREECGCEIDFVGDHHEGGQPLYMFARTLGFRNNIYQFDNFGQANAVMPLSPFSGPITWYEFYLRQREIQLPPTGQRTRGDRTRVSTWNGDPDRAQNAVQDFGLQSNPDNAPHSHTRQGYVKNYPDDFLAMTGEASSAGGGPTYDPSAVLLNSGRERRRMRAAMVNCSAVTGLVADSNGETRQPNDNGTYDVTLDDMRIMDAYIPNPAGIFCGEDTVACDIAGSIETSMYIELIEDVTEDVTSDTFMVQLVR